MLGSFQPLAGFTPLAGWDASVAAAAFSPDTVREAVRHRLASLDALAAKVGGRIWFYNLPQGGSPALPAVTYYVPARTFSGGLDGPDGVSDATIRVSLWSHDAAEAASMADVVRLAFDGLQGRIGRVYVKGCFLDSEADLPEHPRDGDDSYTHQTVLTFSVRHDVSIPSYQ